MSNFSISKANNSIRFNIHKDDIKILQVTDMHFNHFNFKTKKYLDEIKKIIEIFKPDLVINTGDLFCNVPMFYAKKILRDFDSVIGKIVPWAFAWGNHDCEMFKKGINSKNDKIFKNLDALEDLMVKLPHCVYLKSRNYIENYSDEDYRKIQEEKEACIDPLRDKLKRRKFDGFYGGNYKIEVRNGSPSSNLPKVNLFIMNSRRDHSIPPNALKWMSDEIMNDENTPALLFYHVPIFEYHTIWEEKIAIGIKGERICYELDNGRVHNFIKKFPQIKACFVGHDHVNDYMGTLDGIEYVYGRKTGPLGYGGHRSDVQFKFGEKKIKYGAKLISLKFNSETGILSSFDHISVFDDGTTWKPTKMELMREI